MTYHCIYTIDRSFSFVGKYRRDLERENWHYYEKEDGRILHLRKEHIIAVETDPQEDALAPKSPNKASSGDHKGDRPEIFQCTLCGADLPAL